MKRGLNENVKFASAIFFIQVFLTQSALLDTLFFFCFFVCLHCLKERGILFNPNIREILDSADFMH